MEITGQAGRKTFLISYTGKFSLFFTRIFGGGLTDK